MLSIIKPMTLAAVLLTAATAHANGYGRSFIQGYGHSYAHQKFIYPSQITVYMVGAQIRSAAEVEALKRQDPIYQLGLQMLQQQQPQTDAAPQANPAVPADALPQQQASQIQASCIRCHGRDKVDGGLNLTGPITAEQMQSIKAKLYSGEMPPEESAEFKAGFSNEQAGNVLLEAIDKLGAAK